MDLVHLAAEIFRRTPADVLTQFEYNRVRDAVIHAVCLSPPPDKAAVIQDPQVLGDIGLISVQRGHNVVDASLALL